jgi:hypothetical protein
VSGGARERVAVHRTHLIEAAHVDGAGERDAEGLGAEDALLLQLVELREREREVRGGCKGRVGARGTRGAHREVDGVGELHGQLGRHHRGEDDDAVKQELVARARGVGEPAHEHVARGDERKDEEEEDEEERLARVDGDALGGEEDGANEAALAGGEARAQHKPHGAAVGR